MAKFPLQKGSTGQEVRIAQKFLNAVSILQGRTDRISADGKYGSKSAALATKILGRPYISQGDFNLGLKAIPSIAARLTQMKSTGQSPDASLRQLLDYNQRLFYNLLDIYRIYKSDPKRNGKNKKYYVYAWQMVVRFNKRMAFFNTSAAKSKGFSRRGFRAEYRDVIQELRIAGVGSVTDRWKMAKPVLAFVFLGVFGTSIVDSFSAGAGDSKTDWQQSEKIKKILRTLDPRDREAIEAEVEQQLEGAYEGGFDDGDPGFFANLGKSAKNMALGALLLVGFLAYRNSQNG